MSLLIKSKTFPVSYMYTFYRKSLDKDVKSYNYLSNNEIVYIQNTISQSIWVQLSCSFVFYLCNNYITHCWITWHSVLYHITVGILVNVWLGHIDFYRNIWVFFHYIDCYSINIYCLKLNFSFICCLSDTYHCTNLISH